MLNSWELFYVAIANMGWVSYRTCAELATLGRQAWWWRLRWAMYRAWFGCAPRILVARALRQAANASEHGNEATGPKLKKQKLKQKNNFDTKPAPPVEDDLVYGETLPGTAWAILNRAEVTAQDCVVDLGCGRGVVPLVASLALGAKSYGVDILPGYVQRCQRASNLLGLEELAQFSVIDFRSEPLPSGTVYFIAGTCLPEESWQALTRRLAAAVRAQTKTSAQVSSSVRAISVSQPLPSEHWELIAREEAPFSWDNARVYYHRWKH